MISKRNFGTGFAQGKRGALLQWELLALAGTWFIICALLAVQVYQS
jgi:hypothetical protein